MARRFWLCALAAAMAAVSVTPSRADEVRAEIVASIRPVHSLLTGVMAGAGRPALLLKGAGSPHHAQMKPSEARMLARAKAVFWIGPGLEDFLAKPLAGHPGFTVGLATVEGVEKRRHAGGGFDPHLWLDPANAAAMVRAMVIVLANIDPDRLVLYRANGARVLARLGQLDREMGETLAPVRARPFIVFHDAYNHLNARFGLNQIGAVTLEPDQPTGAAAIRGLRRLVETGAAVCVFAEPPKPAPIVATLTGGTKAATAVLDPLGFRIAPGPDHYFATQRALAGAMAGCLAGQG